MKVKPTDRAENFFDSSLGNGILETFGVTGCIGSGGAKVYFKLLLAGQHQCRSQPREEEHTEDVLGQPVIKVLAVQNNPLLPSFKFRCCETLHRLLTAEMASMGLT